MEAKKKAERLAAQIERLQMRQGPPANLPLGIPQRICFELTDDMGRKVSVQSSLQLTATLHTANGSILPYTVILSNESGSEGQNPPGFRAGASCCTVLMTPVHRSSCEAGKEVSAEQMDLDNNRSTSPCLAEDAYVTFAASSAYNPSGRVALGMLHTILSASAGPCKISAQNHTPGALQTNSTRLPAADRVRFFKFGGRGGANEATLSLRISEDARAHGHGTSHTWGTAWDSGVVLGACVAQLLTARASGQARPWNSFSAVELGCGGGVAGLALAASLGLRTILTDGEPCALRLTEKNIELNDLKDIASTALLNWGNASQAAGLHPPVDLVLAADVAYKQELFEPLAASISALSGPKTMVLLSFRRRTGGVKAFFDILERDFSIEPVPDEFYDPCLRSMDIVIFELRRKATPEENVVSAAKTCSNLGTTAQHFQTARSDREGPVTAPAQDGARHRRDGQNIIVTVPLPELCSANHVNLEVVDGKALEVALQSQENATGLLATTPAILRIPLGVNVDPETCKAKFSKKRMTLTVTLAVTE